jgi:hypothetical protein
MEKTTDNETAKKEVNNGAGKPYFTQRNNKKKPASACNVTSMIIALNTAGWPVETFAPAGEQPEDMLMKFIFSDTATLNRWRQLDPKGNIPPNQWHAVLAYGTIRWLKTFGHKSPPVVFREAVSREEIISAIGAGGAAVISGLFPRQGKTPLRHVVAAVGYGVDKNGFYFIIDDPWGDYHTGYTSHNGKGIRMPLADFNSMMNPQGQERKWAHIVQRFAK